jgi:YHS domain-containing protein
MSFIDQVKLMRSTDIILTVHGAALTNIAFMKPCSIVLEVFPFAYHYPKYYGNLAIASGLIRYDWQEYFNNTIFNDHFTQDSAPNCMEILGTVIFKAMKQYGDNINDPSVMKGISLMCYFARGCHSCFRSSDSYALGVTITIKTLIKHLEIALNERKKCIAANPFYNPSLELKSYPYIQDYDLNDGDVISSDNSTIYYLYDGKRFYLCNQSNLASFGYSDDNIIEMSQYYLRQIPSGDGWRQNYSSKNSVKENSYVSYDLKTVYLIKNKRRVMLPFNQTNIDMTEILLLHPYDLRQFPLSHMMKRDDVQFGEDMKIISKMQFIFFAFIVIVWYFILKRNRLS